MSATRRSFGLTSTMTLLPSFMKKEWDAATGPVRRPLPRAVCPDGNFLKHFAKRQRFAACHRHASPAE